MQELCNMQVTFEWHFFKKDEVKTKSLEPRKVYYTKYIFWRY